MDCSLPGSSVHGILQTRILEWITMPSSRGIFLTQGLNPHLLHLLHWQMGSLPLPPPEKLISVYIGHYRHFGYLRVETINEYTHLELHLWLSNVIQNILKTNIVRVGNGNPLQCSCLENSMNREAWWAYSTWGCMSRTCLYEFHFYLQKKDWERKKKSPANSHICGSEWQLLSDTILISGDQIF